MDNDAIRRSSSGLQDLLRQKLEFEAEQQIEHNGNDRARAHEMAQKVELEIKEMIDNHVSFGGSDSSESQRGKELHDVLAQLHAKRERLREVASTQLTELRAKEAELTSVPRERQRSTLDKFDEIQAFLESENAKQAILEAHFETQQIANGVQVLKSLNHGINDGLKMPAEKPSQLTIKSIESKEELQKLEAQKLEALRQKLESERELNTQRHDEIVAEFVKLQIAKNDTKRNQEECQKGREQLAADIQAFERRNQVTKRMFARERARLMEQRKKYDKFNPEIKRNIEEQREKLKAEREAINTEKVILEKQRNEMEQMKQDLDQRKNQLDTRQEKLENAKEQFENDTDFQRERERLEVMRQNAKERQRMLMEETRMLREDRAKFEREKGQITRYEIQSRRKLNAQRVELKEKAQKVLEKSLALEIPDNMDAGRLTKAVHRMAKKEKAPASPRKPPASVAIVELEALRRTAERRVSVKRRKARYSIASQILRNSSGRYKG